MPAASRFAPGIGLLAGILLAGCATDAAPPPAQTPPLADQESCIAHRLGVFLGKEPSAEVMANIGNVVGERQIRTIRPGDAVTMDYAPSRLNVELGEDGRIGRFRCG